MKEGRDSGGVDSFAAASLRLRFRIVLMVAALVVAGVLVWQGITGGGNPNPEAPNTSRGAAILDIGVLVLPTRKKNEPSVRFGKAAATGSAFL